MFGDRKGKFCRKFIETRHKKRIKEEHNYTSDNVGVIEKVDTIRDRPEFNYHPINADFKQARLV